MNKTPPNDNTAQRPLVVDLDGTLLRSDLLAESFLRMLKQSFLTVFSLPGRLMQGKAAVKDKIARSVDLDVAAMPFHADLLNWLRMEKQSGRRIILSTASNEKYARQVADHLKIFDSVQASDAEHNLSGVNKRDLNVRLYGHKGFDYAGNSRKDLPVWEAAAKAIVVSPEAGLLKKVERIALVERTFLHKGKSIQSYLRVLRIHQWLKNLLIFIPFLAGHYYKDHLLSDAVLAFFAFSFCASGAYILNDLLDLEEDRRHGSKRHRPFASGTIPPAHGLILFPALSLAAFGLSFLLPGSFTLILLSYLALTILYSFSFKQKAVLDIITLAILYTLRILAGSAAINVENSFWMLLFSMFVFFGLAIIKRYTELISLRDSGALQNTRGRGYHVDDLELLSSLGVGSGHVSVLVLALYINDTAIQQRYQSPELLWLACPLLLYWLSRAWIIAHRGGMHDDPVVFAIKDRGSIAIAALMVIIFLGAI